MRKEQVRPNSDKGEPPQGDADDIGFGRPPRATRFKPGCSGNPRGRPRGAKARRTIVEDLARELHWVTEDGHQRQRTTLELIILRLRAKALSGDLRAIEAFRGILDRYDPQETTGGGAVLVVPVPMTAEEWCEAFAKTPPVSVD
jgi:hypothetical protein